MNEGSGVEKRRFPRHPVNSPLRYHDTQTKSYGGSMTLDISQGGVCFLAGRSMPRGTFISLTLPVADRVFNVYGKTTYTSFVSNVGLYRTGLEFQNPDQHLKTKILDEIQAIQEFQKKLSAELGIEVSEREASEKWVDLYAKHFSFIS